MNENQIDKNKSGMTDEQRQNVKKFIVFSAMGLIFMGCMYLIFSPSADDKAKTEATQGFNADIPMPKDDVIIGDKRDAYEQEQIKQRQEERMRSLQDFTSLLGNNLNPKTTEVLSELTIVESDAPTQRISGGYVTQNRSQSSIQTSAQAYQDMSRTLGNFYEKPREDPEKERLREELEELKMLLDETDNHTSMENQLELMEKSFQMAAMYIPGNVGTGNMGTNTISQTNIAEPLPTTNNNVSGKTVVAPVTLAQTQIVSALLPEMSDAQFIETYSQPRNIGFLTVTGEVNAGTKNTVSACVHTDQTIMDGQNARLRILEPMLVGNTVIPRNTTLTGTARIQGERLAITVVSLEYAGTIIPIELRVYDLDGQSGIFIPNMAELSAAKEIIANMGTSAGTSINLSNDAGKQFAADMGRNAIQGISQYTAKKLREVKVHLKAGYKIYLLANN